MLEGVLYEVLGKADGGAIVRLLPESPIFAAHFPGYPIAPGVTVVRMAMELMGRNLKGIKEVKFVAPLFPDKQVRFEWTVEADGKAQVQVFQLPEALLCAKMSLSVCTTP